jgi:hypothetical protein
MGFALLYPSSTLLFYFGFGGLLDIGVALAMIIVTKATPTLPICLWKTRWLFIYIVFL